MRTLLREPLFHFLAIGALLFAVGAVVGEPDDPTSRRVVVTAGEIERLAATFHATWHRPPTDVELHALVEDWTTEEIFYREAIAMGLDRDDSIVRRRMRQKLEFLATELADADEPREAELEAWLRDHADDYRAGETVDLVQVFVGTDEARAGTLLDTLRGGADPTGLGDPLHVPRTLSDAPTSVVDATFGPEFAEAVAMLPLGQWSGPVASGYGLHLVRVDERVRGTVPPLAAIRDDVLRDVSASRRGDAERSFREAVRARYEVSVEWP